ncbi:MAG: glycosyltransferase family 1 protein [Planctomycetota bacterium]|nr:MAG: glycosyltransferase family 1 protein [Planctomycetota bacterium]
MNGRPSILILAPGCDGTDVGESWSCFQWVRGLARHCDVTLLTLQRPGRQAIQEQLPNIEVVSWPDLHWGGRMERVSSMLKPGYVRFYRQARRWIKMTLHAGRSFDVIHQIGPLALRYPCPAVGLGVPFILGPLAGSLETPMGFTDECRGAPWYTSFRNMDRLRLRMDPWLRRSYAQADVVIGVAPYVADLLRSIPIQRFEMAAETGIHQLMPRLAPREHSGIRLLYVGRVVRTKGLRDAIRAMAQLKDLPHVTLDAIGAGEDLDACRRLAHELQLGDRVRFHGRQLRAEVERFYCQADIFLFPSFREPSGNVVFEAMGHGLPVITTDRGGPGYVVDQNSGIRVPANEPQQLARDLAVAVRQLANDPERLARLSTGARERACDIGLWENKIHWMTELYHDVIASHAEQLAGAER